MLDARLLTRVALRNYKSIGACDVPLGPLMFLVGPNGSGKSNFLDALRFVADALRSSLEHAFRERGGIAEVRRRSGGHPTHFGVRLDFQLREGAAGYYSFRVGAKSSGEWKIQREECSIRKPASLPSGFVVEDGELRTAPRTDSPAAFPDRLYLPAASGLPEFQPVYDALSRMRFYSPSPDRIRDLQSRDPGEVLAPDGANLASVLARLAWEEPALKQRIQDYLGKIAPGVLGVDPFAIGPRETLEFRERAAASRDGWRFFAANISDGTLRTLGVLASVFQSARGRAPLVGVEEPAAYLYPASAAALCASLRDASEHTQVLASTHSGDLLNEAGASADSILAFQVQDGNAVVGAIDEVSRSALRDRVYTPGELLRMDQLRPDAFASAAAEQMDLFGDALVP